MDSNKVPTIESSPPSKDEVLVPAEDLNLSAPPTLIKSGDHIDVLENSRAPSSPREGLAPSSEGKRADSGENPGINKHQSDLKGPLTDPLREPTKPDATVDLVTEFKVFTTEPPVAEEEPENQLKEEQDGAVQKRIGPKMVKSDRLGTLGPFEQTLRVGSVTPPPKPTTEKPKWKLPPKPVGLPLPNEKKAPSSLEAVIRSPPLDALSTETLPEKPTESEERQGRTIGTLSKPLTPPVIAPKPLIKRPGVMKVEETKSGAYCTQSPGGVLLRINGTKVTPPQPVVEDVSKESSELLQEGTPPKFLWFHVVDGLWLS